MLATSLDKTGWEPAGGDWGHQIIADSSPDDPMLMEKATMTDTDNHDYPPENRISDAEWANRRLCPDGSCIGVIGPDGRCKECGRPAE